jgi:hypothetical protein
MKKNFILLSLAFLTIGANAQLVTPFDFETAMADTVWNLFANGAAGSDDDVIMAANPYNVGINLSDSVLQITVRDDADEWVGMWNDYIDPMEFTMDRHILTMMVYKSKISPCTMKIELPVGGGAAMSADVSNTLTDEWELLTFDISSGIGKTYKRLTVFPDFPAIRTEGGIVYLDNFNSPWPTSIKEIGTDVKVYPNPAHDNMFVQHPGMTSLSVSNLLGQTVKAYEFGMVNSKTIDVSELQNGVYLLNVESEIGSYTSKFIKK